MTPPSGVPLRLITGRTVSRVIEADYPGCVEVVRAAYLAHSQGQSVNPISSFLRFPERPDSRIIALPAYLGAPWNVAGIKWIASFPENIRRGFQRASAVLVLNSVDDGYAFAFIEASVISAARTAASAALAAAHLMGGHRRVRCLGMSGTGLIAKYVYRFLLGSGWECDQLCLYDIVPERAEQFRRQLLGLGTGDIRIARKPEELIENSGLIVLATVAGHPHIHDPHLFAHSPAVLHLSLRDLAPEILLQACNIVDDVNHVLQAATSAQLAETLSGNRAFITGTLAEVIEGRCAIDRSKPVIFSPFGLGVLDLALGKWVYDRAVAAGDAVVIDDFLGDWES